MLTDFKRVWNGHQGPPDVTELHIYRTSHHIPLVHPDLYRVELSPRQVVAAAINWVFAERLIEPAAGECVPMIILDRKLDGLPRFCVDHWTLNAVILRELYPLPFMDDYIEILGDSKMVSALGVNSGY